MSVHPSDGVNRNNLCGEQHAHTSSVHEESSCATIPPYDQGNTTALLPENIGTRGLPSPTTADASSAHNHASNSSGSNNNNDATAAHPALHDNNLSVLISSYKRDYPAVEELAEQANVSGAAHRFIEEKLQSLRSDVAALREETSVLECHVDDLRRRQDGQEDGGVRGTRRARPRQLGSASTSLSNVTNNTVTRHASNKTVCPTTTTVANICNDSNASIISNTNNSNHTDDAVALDGNGAATALGATQQPAVPLSEPSGAAVGEASSVSRSSSTLAPSTVQTCITPISSVGRHRGRGYRNRIEKSASELFLSVEDKLEMFARERKCLDATEEQQRRESEEMWAQLRATVDEAQRRIKELRLEALHLQRDVHVELAPSKSVPMKLSGQASASASTRAAATSTHTLATRHDAQPGGSATRESIDHSQNATSHTRIATANKDGGDGCEPPISGAAHAHRESTLLDTHPHHDEASAATHTHNDGTACVNDYATHPDRSIHSTANNSAWAAAPMTIVSASAEELQRYLNRRSVAHANYLDKLKVQSEAAAQDILRVQQQLRQRRAAGEAFSAVDFELLQIENQQSTARLEERKAEVVQLKGLSTRTVQSLNTLLDTLNELTNEQTRMRKECQSRAEYLARCRKDVELVSQEAVRAERRHDQVKAQHEAVRVPKIEQYIAQKAELYELEQALKNWSRKTEIAEGRARTIRQQTRKLTTTRDCVTAYVSSSASSAMKKKSKAIPAASATTAPRLPPVFKATGSAQRASAPLSASCPGAGRGGRCCVTVA